MYVFHLSLIQIRLNLVGCCSPYVTLTIERLYIKFSKKKITTTHTVKSGIIRWSLEFIYIRITTDARTIFISITFVIYSLLVGRRCCCCRRRCRRRRRCFSCGRRRCRCRRRHHHCYCYFYCWWWWWFLLLLFPSNVQTECEINRRWGYGYRLRILSREN